MVGLGEVAKRGIAAAKFKKDTALGLLREFRTATHNNRFSVQRNIGVLSFESQSIEFEQCTTIRQDPNWQVSLGH